MRRLGLGGTIITDGGMKYIENFPRLEEMFVPKSVTDDEIEYLRRKRRILRITRS